MSKPIIHAKSSAEKFGGKWNDYIEIHEFMDSTKGVISDNRHRALTHNSWFLNNVIERVFGRIIINSENKEVSVKAIAELHVLEDFGNKFIPSAQDYLQEIEFKGWMKGQGIPSSIKKIDKNREKIFISFNID